MAIVKGKYEFPVDSTYLDLPLVDEGHEDSLVNFKSNGRTFTSMRAVAGDGQSYHWHLYYDDVEVAYLIPQDYDEGREITWLDDNYRIFYILGEYDTESSNGAITKINQLALQLVDTTFNPVNADSYYPISGDALIAIQSMLADYLPNIPHFTIDELPKLLSDTFTDFTGGLHAADSRQVELINWPEQLSVYPVMFTIANRLPHAVNVVVDIYYYVDPIENGHFYQTNILDTVSVSVQPYSRKTFTVEQTDSNKYKFPIAVIRGYKFT